MKRREFLGCAALSCVDARAELAVHLPIGLDAVARRGGRRFGFAVSSAAASNPAIMGLLRQHAGVITAENAMKWNQLENLLGALDFSRADQVVALADGLSSLLRGHTLAWHQSTPNWLASATPETFVKAQTACLQALVSRYRGRIHTWDVLNEVIDAEQTGGMRDSVLSRLWGVDRYPELFELAHAIDPHARLAYNDYGLEQDEPWCERRRNATLRMLDRWVGRATFIDTVGLQAHLRMDRKFSASRLLRFFDELQAFGLRIQITELDVTETHLPGDVASRDAAIAALFREFTQVCASHPAVDMIVMWNVTDADSWINRWWQSQRRADGQAQRPTLFDEQGQAKPAFHAVAAGMAAATYRH